MDWDTARAFDVRDKSQFPQVPAGGSAIRDVLEDVSLTPDRMLTMIPRQMHLHTTSEHSRDGMLVRCIPGLNKSALFLVLKDYCLIPFTPVKWCRDTL
jgi:hypothetical protein